MATIPSSQKTFSVNEGVNTVYGGSASMKALSQWYTMQDITDTVRPYQVYTALLTQSGESEIDYISNGSLTVGRTYMIVDVPVDGCDFTNVGAPNNEVDTLFVATGTTPNKWGTPSEGENTLSFDLGAPVVTVLENTIGNIWFTYDGIGAYAAHSDDLFTINKTVTQMLPEQYIEGLTDIFNYQSFPTNVNMIAIGSLANYNSEDSRLGNYAQNAIEIRVYN
jgi:hypothetical protein